VYVMQHCTHPRFQRYEIPNIHAYYSDMRCVSPASFLRFSDIAYRASYGVVGPRFTRVKRGRNDVRY
jgi:hypothetical protein